MPKRVMREVGRNDPCPCGSGVKYKYCCLHKEEDEQNDQALSSELSPTDSTSSPESSSSPVVEAHESFRSSDYEGQRALVDDIIGDPDRMDAENAFNMINDLTPKAIERGDADWLAQAIRRLETEQPEVYDAERPYLLMSHLAAAAATGRVDDVVAERVEDLETLATQDIDQFHPCIELIAYHGPLAPIAEAMDNALEAIRADSGILPHGKDRFCDLAIQYALLAEYEQHGEVDLQTLPLRALLDRIDDPDWGEVDFDFLEQVAARLSGPNDQPWQVEKDPVENVDWLTMDFMCAVHETRDVPLGRGHLARKSIVECYGRRHEQYPSLGMTRLLQLEQRDVREQLDEIGSFMSSHPHRRAAFFSLLPAWLTFLEDRSILNAAKTDTMYQNLRPLRTTVARTLENFSSDPTLVRDVKTAWG